jgi:glucan 1,3-beta-glucosidase
MRFLLALWAVLAVVQAAYWMEDLKRQGVAPYSIVPEYKVFRNVKDWGAKGDGGKLVRSLLS